MNIRIQACVFLFFVPGAILLAQCPPLGPIVGPPQLCSAAPNPNVYSIPNSADANLVWTITVDPDPNSVQFVGPPVGEVVVLQWWGPVAWATVIHLCATPTNPCYDPTPICLDIIPPPHLDPVPVPFTVCEGDEVVFEWQGPQGQNYTWWSLPHGIAIGAPQQGSGDLIFTAQNPTDMPLFGGGHVTSWVGSCRGISIPWSLYVNPKPEMNQPADVSVCGGAPVSVTFSGSPNATFTWTNDNPAIGLPAAGTGHINYVSPKVPQPEVGTITVTPQYTNNGVTCSGEPVTFQITLDGAVVEDPPDITVCPGAPVSVAFAGNGDSYSWTNSNPAIGLGASGTGDINFSAEGSALQQTATITVTPQPCPFASQTFNITVLPAAFVNQPADVVVCSGKLVTVALTGSLSTTFNWTNSNPAIGLPASGSGPFINFSAANVQSDQTATVTVTPVKDGCTGQPVTFQITVERCCATSAGDLDTNFIAVCGPKTVQVIHLGNENLEPNDTIRFILYSNPADPMGSIVQYSDTLYFPFLQGVMHFDSVYYAAAIVGPQMANDSIDASAGCFSLMKGPELLWRSIPTITVGSPPDSVCRDGCADVLFTFTGTPPFGFTWLIEQGGQVLIERTETATGYSLTLTVCPSDFDVPGMDGAMNFRVNFLMDMFCGCGE
ncbi:MAG: hypothetical protein DYG98_22525 [Haliscomenobacteraceae bacterium CHB4]|nr:hypothetical protein [Saprospiraceae bacterium]MCE7925836.1 hypothetical protein [Haliscomenobacteraceae bacterium CHB4]